MIKLKLADIAFGVENKYAFTEALTRDYLTADPPQFVLSVSDSEIERERLSERESADYLESIAIYRKLAEKLPEYDAFVFHAATLNVDGDALAFTAKSGVGKTTHTRLWIDTLGKERVHYLNGDKPIIRFIDGTPVVYGTPYRGKEGFGRNESAPLRAITFVERGEVNEAENVELHDAVLRLAGQIYMPRSPISTMKTLKLLDRLVRKTELLLLRCTPDSRAVAAAYRAIYKEELSEYDK